MNSFVRFLEETSDWKNHFDFVWPLGQGDKNRVKLLWHLNSIYLAWLLNALRLNQSSVKYLKVRQNRNDFSSRKFPPKNERTNSLLLLWDLFSFVFWRKLKTSKRHFEINWPLATARGKVEFMLAFLLEAPCFLVMIWAGFSQRTVAWKICSTVLVHKWQFTYLQ